MNLGGAADYRFDELTNPQVCAAMDWFRTEVWKKESPEPQFALVMTPVGIDAGVWGIHGYGPMGLVAVNGWIIVGFEDTDKTGRHYVSGVSVTPMLGALAPVRGKRWGQRFFFYAKNDEGNELVLEFRSEVEARALARWVGEGAAGQPGGGWDGMPAVPEIGLASHRGKFWKAADLDDPAVAADFAGAVEVRTGHLLQATKDVGQLTSDDIDAVRNVFAWFVAVGGGGAISQFVRQLSSDRESWCIPRRNERR